MKIAFVVPYVPTRIRTRPFNLIRGLVKRGHQVTLFTLWVDASEKLELDNLRRECHSVVAFPLPRWRSLANCIAALPSSLPLQAVYSWHPDLAFHIEKNAKSNGFDVIHIEHLRGSRYGQHLKSRLTQIPLVWDSVDCISHLFSQAAGESRSLLSKLITRFELSRTRSYEGRLPEYFDHVIITSRTDRKALLELILPESTPAPISVLPNGVDLAYFQEIQSIERETASVVFSGKMSYHANITMALFLVKQVMPHIWQNRPEVKLTIVGKDPPSSIQALGANPAISVTGTVEDMRPYLHRATVSATPMIYGAGIQNKLLEAMACGTPVVATPQAISSLTVRQGEDLLVAGNARDFADAIISLINNSELRKRVGEAGKTYVETYHNWDTISGQLEGIYNEVIDTKAKISRSRISPS